MDIIKYQVIITPTAYEEINKIYNYISTYFYARTSAKILMRLVEREVEKLKYSPKIHMKIKKCDELQRRYRRIIVKRFVILYTIDEINNIVYVAHMYHSSQNYLN